jgi:hypothetical protein
MERKGRKRVCRGCICTSFHLLHDRAFWIWVGRDEEYRRTHTCTPEYWVAGVVVYSSSCRVCNAIRKQQLGRCIPYPEDSCGNHADTHTHTHTEQQPKKEFLFDNYLMHLNEAPFNSQWLCKWKVRVGGKSPSGGGLAFYLFSSFIIYFFFLLKRNSNSLSIPHIEKQGTCIQIFVFDFKCHSPMAMPR